MNLPNKITLARLILIPFFMLVFYLQFTGHYIASAVIFAVAALTDFLDGHLARKLNLVTDLGKFLDPIADKVLVLVALIVMLSVDSTAFFGQYGIFVGGIGISIIIARELAVSSLRMLAAKNGTVLAADKLGKIKTFLTDIAIIVLMFSADLIGTGAYTVISISGQVLFILAVLITVVSGISYLVKNKEAFKE